MIWYNSEMETSAPHDRTGLLLVIDTFGSQAALAEFCAVTPQAVSDWATGTGQIPLKHVEAISRRTSLIPAMIRPDLAPILRTTVVD